MRYSKQLIITIPILLITFFSCTKFTYEKDEIVGNWNIGGYFVDGVDSTEYFKQFKYSDISITTENKIYISCIRSDTSDLNSVYAIGNWSLSSRNELINFNMKSPGSDQDLWLKKIPFYPNTVSAWKILYLDKNSFKLRTKIEGVTYELNLILI